MSALGLATAVGTILSGLVSGFIILSMMLDAITHGWVRDRVRRWLGIEGLRDRHKKTQIFLLDLGEAHNELAETVSDEHDLNQRLNIGMVKTAKYNRDVAGQDDVERGDYISENDD